MRIIISPAKKMRVDTDSFAPEGLPAFLPETGRLLAALKEMDGPQLQKLWKCNDSIAALNLERLAHMDLEGRLTPALLSYEGIQYQYMAPGVFDREQLDYVKEHLRILSGFYGLLRPFDGVTPYRLEMAAPLKVDGHKDLYAFWGGHAGKGFGRRDRSGGQSGLQGVQQSGLSPSAPLRNLPHLHLWRGEGRQGGGKRHHVQDGPGRDGPLDGGASCPTGGGAARF